MSGIYQLEFDKSIKFKVGNKAIFTCQKLKKRVMKKKSILIIAVLIVLSTYAHEYVLIASEFNVQRGDTLELHLFVADGFNIELERPLQKEIIKKFELTTQNTNIDLLAENKDASYPILKRKVDFDGLGLIHMERGYSKITLENKKFISYLEEDHIENINIQKSTKKEQRERYSRYIKCLVQSGKSNEDTSYKIITGHQFEIILLQNPYRIQIGKSLQAQVFFKGIPLANKVITIRNRTGGESATRQLSRTNANGICTFMINRKGDWFIHATQMIKCPEPSEADWESYWTSYSFGIK